MTPLTRFALTATLLMTAASGIAQGPPGRDPYNPPPGHGGVPPGQAKKQGYGNMPPGQAKKYDRQNDNWRFRDEDRDHFYSHYRRDADRWRGKKRPKFARGYAIPQGYYIRPVPRSYWQGVPPPPPGYQYGYYDGYVVSYDPTTRIIADVLDLVSAATQR
ncbi:hypothetical protein [Edaphobacter albus]|uniref:hypothetical protein n=1 Tax=Edaphobacter sp. 4G125 TaxID=2763071 RepID=UPI00164914DB|nr:hypothetical protein [Edaphobacter sp. 4G125]QNI37560.1 hypothetical protein H7846_04455 [Edaphobacter sp. 4G125]